MNIKIYPEILKSDPEIWSAKFKPFDKIIEYKSA